MNECNKGRRQITQRGEAEEESDKGKRRCVGKAVGREKRLRDARRFKERRKCPQW